MVTPNGYLDVNSRKNMTNAKVSEFLNDLHSDATRDAYHRAIRKFVEWIKTTNVEVSSTDSILSIPKEDLQQLLEHYVYFLKPRISPNSVPKYIAAIESFLDYNGVFLNKKKLHKKFPKKIKPSGGKAYSVEQLDLMIKSSVSKRNRALIKTLCSSGIREGAIPILQLKHLQAINDPDVGKCYLLIVYAGEEEEYVTFMTPEASIAFDEYVEERISGGEEINSESFCFIHKMKKHKRFENYSKFAPIDETMIRQIILPILRLAKIDRGFMPQLMRYEISEIHGMRKFFDTALNKAKIKIGENELPAIHHNDIEKLMGHKNGLKGLYYNPDSDYLFKEYKKAIPYLTLEKELRQESELQQNKLQLKEFSEISTQNKITEKRLTEVESKLEKVERLNRLYEQANSLEQELTKIKDAEAHLCIRDREI